jgi:hypothetical protein
MLLTLRNQRKPNGLKHKKGTPLTNKNVKKRYTYEFLVVKSEGRRPIGRIRVKWEKFLLLLFLVG